MSWNSHSLAHCISPPPSYLRCMIVGFTKLAVRSSPTSRSLLRKAPSVVQIRVPSRSLSPKANDLMLAKANKAFEANPPPGRNNNLAKQLFPSSSPSAPVGDIRDQFKKPGSTNHAAATSASSTSSAARTTGSAFSKPLDQQPSATSIAGQGRLATLYAKSDADAFKADAGFVDLTEPDVEVKAKSRAQEVDLFEDDFSDDDNLDLDFQAPCSLPVLKREVKENVPPRVPERQSELQAETEIPWSSSPASHYFPSKAQSSTAKAPATPAPKRSIDAEHDATEVVAERKAKKRVLPATFRIQDPPEEKRFSINLATPPPAKSKGIWDASASVIQEQKRQFKTQRQAQAEAQGVSLDAAATTESGKPKFKSKHSSKSDAISLSNEQEHVLDMVVNHGKSVFFTGPAGTGKSVLMRAIINRLKQKYLRDPERVAVTASTGLAACNIGGITLHSFAGIGLGKEDAGALVKKIRRNPKAKNRWLRTNCLILDEVSMVDGDLFDKLSQIGRTIRNNGRPWGGIQLILTGDFFQLPPVPDAQSRDIKFAFEAATWGTSIDHTIGLTQVFRQRDPEFARMLNEMRLGQISQATVDAFKALARPLQFDDGVESAELFPTRAQVDGSNERRLRELPGKAHRYDACDVGEQALREKLLANMMAPKSLELKINSQVMLIKNLDESLVNGTLGKVIGFSDERTFDMTNGDSFPTDMSDNLAKARKKLSAYSHNGDDSSNVQKFPVVHFIATDGISRVILCQPEEWKVELPNGEMQAKRVQLPLILAWALSIHKAQGQTLERVTVNLGRVFEKGQAYVALSRATSQEGLRVLGFDKSKVMAHPRVITFYRQLYSAEEAVGRRPNSIGDFVTNRRGVKAPPAQKPSEVLDLNEDEEEAMASFGY